MVFTLLYVRKKQLQTEINGLGLYAVLLIIFIFFLIFISYKQFNKLPNAYYLTGVLAFVCLWLQSYRKDKLFVYKHLADPHLQILSEYVTVTFLFSIPALFTGNWFCYPILLVLLFCIPYLQFTYTQRTRLKNLSSVIPPSNYEWIGGFRKNYILFSCLYLFAITFSWLRVLPLILLWFLTVAILSFHSECEPLQILREGSKRPRKYLSDKLIINILYLLLLYAPILIVNAIVNQEFIVINLLFILCQVSLLSFAITLKYATYAPNKNQITNNFPLLLVSLGSAIPYLLPIPAILSLVYFNKANRRLNQYLND